MTRTIRLCTRIIMLSTLSLAITHGGFAQDLPAPQITLVPALHGATLVSLNDKSSAAVIFYTLDGSAPGPSSFQYVTPLLVTQPLELRAVAVDSGGQASAVASQVLKPLVRAGALVWSDEFNRKGLPDSQTWAYDLGNSGFGNKELETYCAPASSVSPCDATQPNAFQSDGRLHLVARDAGGGNYTSARLKTQGQIAFQYGRMEARVRMPEAQGMWPAFWALGANIAKVGWPASGEEDIMEHIDAPNPDWVAASLHGPHGDLTQHYPGVSGKPFDGRGWHTYGMIWKKKSIAFYVDSPTNIYARWTPESLAHQAGAIWPFDSGPIFLLLNLAVGGNWPGSPDPSTKFPAEMLVDWVRVYSN